MKIANWIWIVRETLAKSSETLALILFLFFEFLKFVGLKTENWKWKHQLESVFQDFFFFLGNYWLAFWICGGTYWIYFPLFQYVVFVFIAEPVSRVRSIECLGHAGLQLGLVIKWMLGSGFTG